MLTIALCDDDKQDLTHLKSLLQERYGEGGARLFSFLKPEDALVFLKKHPDTDILLLDILMPGQKGTDLAIKLRNFGYCGYIIFLTFSNDFAAESYEAGAFSYLLKPVRQDMLYPILDKLERHMEHEDRASVVVTIGHKIRRIPFTELSYLEANSHMSHFNLRDGAVISSRKPFSEYASELLADERFTMCHGSFVVNMDYIETLGPQEIILLDGDCLPIAKRYKECRRTYMKRLLGQEEGANLP